MGGLPKSLKHIAVFGDLHGHLRLMYQLCRLWQLEHRIFLDAVLACGDLGFFPNPAALDKATERFSHRDPEEMGFTRFFAWPDPPEKCALLDRILNGPSDDLNTVGCRIFWCNGNHEDFQELDRIMGVSPLNPVDAFDRFWLLRSGHTTKTAGICLAAMGGKPEPPDADPSDYGLEDPWEYVGARAVKRLRGEHFNVLMTHGGPSGIGGPQGLRGSRRILEVVRFCQPAYHFFSHHEGPIPPDEIEATQCFWLSDVNFEMIRKDPPHYGPLRAGCMGILRWNGSEEHEFRIVDEPWMSRITHGNWLNL